MNRREGQLAALAAPESAAEHVRNALQLLQGGIVSETHHGGVESADQDVTLRRGDLANAFERLHRAVELLERKASNG